MSLRAAGAGAATEQGTRGKWALRDRPALVWLAAAVIVAVVHPFLPESRWLMVHLVLLGAATHSIMVWSVYFAQALLKTPAELDDRRRQSRRLGLLLIGVTLVLIGVPTALWPVTIIGAAAVTGALIAHGIALWQRLRAALPGRFRITMHYYLASAASLPVGVVAGVLLARGYPDPLHGQLLMAHTMANVLGWVGLTVTGTLITLWPTMLRTKMDQRAERLATHALPMLVAGLVLIIAGALGGLMLLAAAGLVGYGLGLIWWGRSLVLPARTRPPREFAPASVAAALVWGVVAVAWLAISTITSTSWGQWTGAIGLPVAVIVGGFGAQLLSGAMSYLIPVVLGGGPAAQRSAQWWFNRGATARLVIINLGLVIFLLPVPSAVRVVVSVVVLVALAWFIPLVFGAIAASRKVRRENERSGTHTGGEAAVSKQAASASIWRGGQVVAALSALAVAITLGIGMDPAAAGISSAAPAGTSPPEGEEQVAPTGETTTVQVVAEGMRFSPSHIEVPAGDRLIIELTNEDPTDVHDLLLNGQQTPRLSYGESAEIDAGIITGSSEGWCTIVGHRQMGMVLTVTAVGQAQDQPGADAPGPHPSGHHGPGRHGEHHDGAAGAPDQVAPGAIEPRTAILPDGEDLTDVVDARVPEQGGEVHELTLTVQETELEVAPGVWQRRWTFNGQVPGPTLHGQIGDVFKITLVNDGSIGHSIDFHAGSLAPDEPMRTIAPGESLEYTFTAEQAGIWMYHCGTDPMTAHIGAGMFGAVIIEPQDLDPVDREYVLVQSEAYLQHSPDGYGREQALEVDADRARTGPADAVAFNGIAYQYHQEPLQARTGERVRFWVLDAGPNLASSFHIVGAQFDTVYREGAYHLRGGRDAFGNTGGGSQALDLAPAQGGFIETTFPEAGHYPMVSHIMGDAERGASGIVQVSD